MTHIEEQNALGTLTTLCGEDDYRVATFHLFAQPIADCKKCLEISGADDVIHYEHINNLHHAPVTMCFKLVKRANFIPSRSPADKVTCDECRSSLSVLELI